MNLYARGFAYEQHYNQYGTPYPVPPRATPSPARHYDSFIYNPPHCGFSRFTPVRSVPPSFNHIPAYSYPSTEPRMTVAEIASIQERRTHFLTQSPPLAEQAPALDRHYKETTRHHYQEPVEKLAENCDEGKRPFDECLEVRTF